VSGAFIHLLGKSSSIFISSFSIQRGSTSRISSGASPPLVSSGSPPPLVLALALTLKHPAEAVRVWSTMQKNWILK
jgi:hypothetical protein